MTIERRFRRDGEDEYPELAMEDFRFELEVATLNQDKDRVDWAMLNGVRYLRPYDIAKYHWQDTAVMMREVFGPGRKSDKYGRRI